MQGFYTTTDRFPLVVMSIGAEIWLLCALREKNIILPNVDKNESFGGSRERRIANMIVCYW
jgi:hypothetical protein